MSARLWFVSDLFYPESDATGYFVSGVAMGIAERHLWAVSAICAQPGYKARGRIAPTRETFRNVNIYRCWATRFDHKRLFGRAINILTSSMSLGARTLLQVRRHDVVVAVTTPPLLPFLIWLVCALKKARFILLVHDVYPDVLVPTGFVRSNSLAYFVLTRFTGALYRSATSVVVLGRDMKMLVDRKGRAINSRIIENWGDVDRIIPDPNLGTTFRSERSWPADFVVLYSGNHGRTHAIDTILRAAKRFDDRDGASVSFVFSGSGSSKRTAVDLANRLKLVPQRVRFMDTVADDEFPGLLNAADLFVIAFKAGMAGISVPSRLYNALAAGRPILAICDQGSELWSVVEENRVGWCVTPDDIDGIVSSIEQASRKTHVYGEMSSRARALATSKYSREETINKWSLLIGGLG